MGEGGGEETDGGWAVHGDEAAPLEQVRRARERRLSAQVNADAMAAGLAGLIGGGGSGRGLLNASEDGQSAPSKTGASKSSRLTPQEWEKATVNWPDGMPGDDEPDLLVQYAAATKDLELMARALRLGGNVGVQCSLGQTCLHTAMAHDDFEMLEYLLLMGCDPYVVDKSFRDAFYFACFGKGIGNGRHALYASVLLDRDTERGLTLPVERVLCAAYGASSQHAVLTQVLDRLRIEVLHKDSNGMCKILFHGLEKLDSPLVQMTWPDGSRSAQGSTPVDIVVGKGVADALVHPACLGLMHWKWAQFGDRYFRREFLLFGAQVALLTGLGPMCSMDALARETTSGSLNDYNMAVPQSCARAAVELGVVLLAVSALHRLARQYGATASGMAGMAGMAASRPLALLRRGLRLRGQLEVCPLVTQLIVLTVAVLRLARAPDSSQLMLLSLAALLQWERIIYYMSLRQSSGPFFIMITEMFFRDMVPFLQILSALILAFASSIGFLGSAGYADASDNSAVFHSVQNSAIELLFGLIGQDTFPAVRHAWTRDGEVNYLVVVYMLLYTLLGPILVITFFVASMTNTYQTVSANAVAEWALRRFRFLSLRQGFERDPFFGHSSTQAMLKLSAPSAVAPAGQARQDSADCQAAFVLCEDSVGQGYTLHTHWDNIFAPYHDSKKSSEMTDLCTMVANLLARQEALGDQLRELNAKIDKQGERGLALDQKEK